MIIEIEIDEIINSSGYKKKPQSLYPSFPPSIHPLDWTKEDRSVNDVYFKHYWERDRLKQLRL